MISVLLRRHSIECLKFAAKISHIFKACCLSYNENAVFSFRKKLGSTLQTIFQSIINGRCMQIAFKNGSFANVGVVKSICKQVQTAAYQGSNHGISATGGFTSHGYSCRNRVSFVNWSAYVSYAVDLIIDFAVCHSRSLPDWNWIVGVSWRAFRCITTRYFGNAVVICITLSWTQISVFAPAVFTCQATDGLLPKIKLSFDLEYIIPQKNRLVKSAIWPFCRFDKRFILWYNICSCFYGCPFWAAFSVSRRL